MPITVSNHDTDRATKKRGAAATHVNFEIMLFAHPALRKSRTLITNNVELGAVSAAIPILGRLVTNCGMLGYESHAALPAETRT
jgi:hypothetical protein